MKGTMSEAEHHFLRARLHAGVERRAKAGELQKRLPVGLDYDSEGNVQLSPDEAVRHAIETVFARFAALGTAHRVFRSLQEDGILLPSRRNDRPIEWKAASYGAILRILTNRRYAGSYVFGQTRSVRTVDEAGRIRTRCEHRPPSEWRVVIDDHHPGYVSREDFERIQQALDKNCLRGRTDEAPTVLRGGAALLQGLIRCGKCGRRMSPAYTRRGKKVRYVCNRAFRNHGVGIGECFSVGAFRLHQAVVDVFLGGLSPASMEVTLASLDAVNATEDAGLKQLKQRLENARYAADRAQRQYDLVEPENRVVARSLEREWNRRLTEVQELEAAIAGYRHERPPVLSDFEREKLRDLGLDLRAVWESPTTEDVERKQLLRAAIEEISVSVDRATREARVMMLWQGGKKDAFQVQLPRRGEHPRTDPATLIDDVRKMASTMSDAQIASTLCRRGVLTSTGLRFNDARVRSLRVRHEIPEFRPASVLPEGETGVSAEQAAKKLGVTPTTICRWLKEGLLVGDQIVAHAPWRIFLGRMDSLRSMRRVPNGWLTPREAATKLGMEPTTVVHWVREGRLEAVMAGVGKRRGLRIRVESMSSKGQLALGVQL
jgi:excisionase family DNA binding protein